MSVAKKDQERITYAWMYGARARKDGKERVVPQVWEESTRVRADLLKIGVHGTAVQKAHYDFASSKRRSLAPVGL